MRRPFTLGSGLLVIVAAVGGALTVSDGMSSAASPSLHEQTFIDDRSGLAIAAQLDQASSDAGHWSFRIPSVGAYSGNAGTSMRVLTPTSVDLTFEGAATLRTVGPNGTATMRQIRLQAHLDPAHHTGEATLWDGTDRFHLVAQYVDLAGLDSAMNAVEDAIVVNDPVALYPLLNAQATRAYSAAAFASAWSSQSQTLGRITALRRVSVGSPQVTDQGFWYVAVDYSGDTSAPSGPGTASFTAFFINEPSGWKFWTTVRR